MLRPVKILCDLSDSFWIDGWTAEKEAITRILINASSYLCSPENYFLTRGESSVAAIWKDTDPTERPYQNGLELTLHSGLTVTVVNDRGYQISVRSQHPAWAGRVFFIAPSEIQFVREANVAK